LSLDEFKKIAMGRRSAFVAPKDIIFAAMRFWLPKYFVLEIGNRNATTLMGVRYLDMRQEVGFEV
jgi:hypothetical protein